MCRFAWDCLNKMNEVTRRLEVTLGPGKLRCKEYPVHLLFFFSFVRSHKISCLYIIDTGDLSMRFGIHSGPVTAGVLQGERARFQLFGDTVNTASRMESTGVRGKVQISQATATLLEAAGKHSWLKPRKDLIAAKGKGTLKTYWVSPSSNRGSSVSSGTSNGSTESKTEARELEVKDSSQRLVAWITDLLMKDVKNMVHLRHCHGIKEAKTPYSYFPPDGSSLLDEVKTVIEMPACKENIELCSEKCKCRDRINEDVSMELYQYVSEIANLYHPNPFHNFEHAW